MFVYKKILRRLHHHHHHHHHNDECIVWHGLKEMQILQTIAYSKHLHTYIMNLVKGVYV